MVNDSIPLLGFLSLKLCFSIDWYSATQCDMNAKHDVLLRNTQGKEKDIKHLTTR